MQAIHPIKLLLWSLLVWVFFYIQLPVTYLYSGGIWFPLFTLILFVLSFCLGVISLKTSFSQTPKIDIKQKGKTDRIFIFFHRGHWNFVKIIYRFF